MEAKQLIFAPKSSYRLIMDHLTFHILLKPPITMPQRVYIRSLWQNALTGRGLKSIMETC